jgi:hypothetical protein
MLQSTTGKDFLALVPMAHLLRHQPSANGSLTLGLDNTVRVAVGAAHHTGDTIAIDRCDAAYMPTPTLRCHPAST